MPLPLGQPPWIMKIEVGVCKGKKNYDKRDSVAKRDAKRDIDRAMKSYNR